MTSTPPSHLDRLLADLPATVTPRQVWRTLTPEERTEAARAAIESEDGGTVVRAQANAVIAKAKNFRLMTVQQMPADKVAAELARSPVDEALAEQLLIQLHLGGRRPMLAAFMDALGVAHEEGVYSPESLAAADLSEERVTAAADGLAARFPKGEVTTYLLTLLAQDGEGWAGARGWLGKAKG